MSEKRNLHMHRLRQWYKDEIGEAAVWEKKMVGNPLMELLHRGHAEKAETLKWAIRELEQRHGS